ncbi:MAG: sigma-70 family RNA polymerase sigma factor [Pirellulaceae bacterium]|nr:sigma-70 family RNA polymerase sigma factor [Pirellulaceae bacterium]
MSRAANWPAGDWSADKRRAWVLAALDRYELPLVRYARSLVGDLDLARDVVQHAFVKLCNEIPHESDDRLAAWLFRVCRNRALDHLRQAGREQSAEGLTDDREGRELDPAVASETHELAECLRELIELLPAAQREALSLWCEGFAYREIGEIIGRQEGHVRVLVHRGLTRLREHPQVQGWLEESRPPPLPACPAGTGG